MRLQRFSTSLFGVIAIVSVVLAAATVWLFLTNPVTVANAVKWFPDKRGLAAGLTAAGFGGGSALTIIPISGSIGSMG